MFGAQRFVLPARRPAAWRVVLRECAGACLLLAVAAVPSGVAAGPVQLGDSRARPAMHPPTRGERDPLPANMPAAAANTAGADDEQDDAAGPSHDRLLRDSIEYGQGGAQEALVEPPAFGDPGTDPHAEAARAAAEAALGEHEARERSRALRQAYSGRAPTWIQQAATVDLADFPQHGDPSASAEHELQTLQWALAERERLAAVERDRRDDAAGDGRGRGDGDGDGDGAGGRSAIDAEELGTLGLLLPSTWLPLLREHRDPLLASAVGVLLLSWLVGWQTARRRARRHHHHHHHRDPRSRHSHRGSQHPDRHRRDQPASAPSAVVAVEAPLRRKRHRRHASHDSSGRGDGRGVALAAAQALLGASGRGRRRR